MGRPKKAGGTWMDRQALIIAPKIRAILADSVISDPDGKVTQVLTDLIGGPSAGVVSQVLTRMECTGEIVREIRGKRTLSVRLTTDEDDRAEIARVAIERGAASRDAIRASDDLKRAQGLPLRTRKPQDTPPTPQPAEAPIAPTAVPLQADPPEAKVMTLHSPQPSYDSQLVAAELLKLCIDAAMHPGHLEADLADARRRLANEMTEAQRLRQRLRSAEDLALAQREEIDGLRHRAQQAERNLREVAMAPPLDLARERELRGLARTMEAKPGAYAGNGEQHHNGHAVPRHTDQR
jgi:hypothetical protein